MRAGRPIALCSAGSECEGEGWGCFGGRGGDLMGLSSQAGRLIHDHVPTPTGNASSLKANPGLGARSWPAARGPRRWVKRLRRMRRRAGPWADSLCTLG